MNRRSGFTLIELMVTLAVAAMVLTIGIHSFRELLRENRLATQANVPLAVKAGAGRAGDVLTVRREIATAGPDGR